MPPIHLTGSRQALPNYPYVWYYPLQQGYLLTQRPYPLAVGQKNTREIHLSDLGQFPLAREDLPLLTQEIQLEDKLLQVPSLLKRSNIPIFYTKAEYYPVYLPKASIAICRYFATLWGIEGDELVSLVQGFLLIDSFVGGQE